MRTPIASLVLAFVFACFAIPQTASTQTTRVAAHSTATASPPTPAPAACTCPLAAQHVQPYTARQEATRVQALANGATVRNVEEILLARDAEGRTRRETTRTQNGEAITSIQIFDNVTQARYTWNIGANYPKVVNVYHTRSNPQYQPTPQPRRYYPFHSESLPPQTIAGVYAEGSRYTRTTPAGYDGNDHDLVTTTESWYSPSLSLTLRSVVDDPRSGKSTTETSDVNLSDPDPTLFQPPADAQLHDASQ